MADEILKIDANERNGAGAVTDDSSEEIRNLRIDDATKGLKVMIVGGVGAGTVNSVTDGTTTVTDPAQIDFTSGATVTDLGGGVAGVAISGGSSGITVGTTTVTSGTDKGILYNNAGVVGNYTPSASLILATDGSKNVQGLTTATYPSLTELSYVKGVSSSLQTQLNAKQGTITFGTGVQTALGVNIGSAGAFVTFNGALGTPSSGTGTNITGIPSANILAGTLGTGAYTMDTKLTVPQVITTANAITASSNAATIPVTSKNNIVTNDSAGAMTITLTTASAVNMQPVIVQILDFSAVAQTITWVNTEDSTVTAPTTSNGSTTLPLTVGFIYNSVTSTWRTVGKA